MRTGCRFGKRINWRRPNKGEKLNSVFEMSRNDDNCYLERSKKVVKIKKTNGRNIYSFISTLIRNVRIISRRCSISIPPENVRKPLFCYIFMRFPDGILAWKWENGKIKNKFSSHHKTCYENLFGNKLISEIYSKLEICWG